MSEALESTKANDHPLKHRDREIDLDVVRAFAILLAMGWHINGIKTGFAPLEAIMTPGRVIGWAGVDLFFVLSGFLVGRMIFKEYERDGGFDYPKFLVRRIFRLWPVLYAFLIVMLLSRAAPAKDFLWQIALHVQNYAVPTVAVHTWSLAVEEHFYLIFAIGFTALLMLRGHPSHLAWPLLAIMAAVLCARIIGLYLGVTTPQIQWQTQYRIDALACGVLLANLSIYRPKFFGRLVLLKPLWLLLTIAGVTFLVLVPKNTALGATLGYTVSYTAAAAFMLLVYQSGVDRMLYWPCVGLAILGQLAYPIYLFHVPVTKAVAKLWPHVPLVGHSAVALVVADYTAAIIISWAVANALERPFMRLRDKMFPSRAKPVG